MKLLIIIISILCSLSCFAQESDILLENLEFKTWKIDSTVNHVSWMEIQFQMENPDEINWIYVNVVDAETCQKETLGMQNKQDGVAIKIVNDTVILKMNINNEQMISPNFISVAIRNKQNQWSKYFDAGDKQKFNKLCQKVVTNSGNYYKRRAEGN